MHTLQTLITKLFVQCILGILWSSDYLFVANFAHLDVHTVLFSYSLRVADLLPQGPTTMSVLQNLCYSTTWRMGASKVVCFMNLGAILLYLVSSCTESVPNCQCKATKKVPLCFFPTWVLGHQLLVEIIWCLAALPPPYKQWKRLWWTTLTKLLFKPRAIGKFCLGSILRKLRLETAWRDHRKLLEVKTGLWDHEGRSKRVKQSR